MRALCRGSWGWSRLLSLRAPVQWAREFSRRVSPPDTHIKTIVLHPILKGKLFRRDVVVVPPYRLKEAVGLASMLCHTVVKGDLVSLYDIHPATFIGKGKVTEIRALVEELNANCVFLDAALTPVQSRNLEDTWGVRVHDRTSLILEILWKQSRCREAKLQLESIMLQRNKTRHPELDSRSGRSLQGEKQSELARRELSKQQLRIRKELNDLSRIRDQQRENRRRHAPLVTIVGYALSGKTSLINSLTNSSLPTGESFNTDVPVLRGMKLPSGRQVLVADTLSFISDLPSPLIAAFRTTLKDVVDAEVLIHVRDIHHPETLLQKRDVESTLNQLMLENKLTTRYIEVWNKIDMLPKNALALMLDQHQPHSQQHIFPVSLLHNEGLPPLVNYIDEILKDYDNQGTYQIVVDPLQTDQIQWLYQHGKVVRVAHKATKTLVQVILNETSLKMYKAKFNTS